MTRRDEEYTVIKGRYYGRPTPQEPPAEPWDYKQVMWCWRIWFVLVLIGAGWLAWEHREQIAGWVKGLV